MLKKLLFVTTVIFAFFIPARLGAQVYSVKSGKIQFRSEAKLELIKASSNELRGKLDPSKKTFAFTVKINSFKGFNSPLQKEHFNENYLESEKYPDATFSGRMIEDIDLSQDGNFTVRSKGNFTLHGVALERIIKSDISIQKGVLTIVSNFTVQLSDHNIPIPKVVHEKLASEIKVEVKAILQAQ